jgi:hypothetical protein
MQNMSELSNLTAQLDAAAEFVSSLYEESNGKSRRARALAVVSGFAKAIGVNDVDLAKRLGEFASAEIRKRNTVPVSAMVWDIVYRQESSELVPRTSYGSASRLDGGPCNGWSLSVEDHSNTESGAVA